MKRKGSAIIIAFFLMAAISGVTFSIARLFYLDTSASDIYENSTIAYYTAESGVEESLLRYRFDRQSEVGTADLVSRNNLNDLSVSLVNPNEEILLPMDSLTSVFDLRMSYKASFYGDERAQPSLTALDLNDLASSEYGDEYFVPRDESVKIDITDAVDNSGDDIRFMTIMQKYYDTAGFNRDNSFIEAKIVGTTTGSSEVEEKKVLVTDTFSRPNFSTLSVVRMDPNPGHGVDFYYKYNLVNSIIGSVALNTTDYRVLLYLKPIGCDIIIGIDPGVNNQIAAPFTTIKSTGYYGGVSRTLEAKIDRQSGTVYDLFDFVTYQHPQ